MKRIIFVLVTCVVAGHASGSVDIFCTHGPGPNDVTVSFTNTEAVLVRMISLDVHVDGSEVVIADINCVNADYGIYPGSISIDAEGIVTDWGMCGVASVDGNTATTEQGSLYVGAANEPAQGGDLFIITLEGCVGDCGGGGSDFATVTLGENTIRSGVVMEDPNFEPTVNISGTTVTGLPVCAVDCCPCLGDIDGPTTWGGPDGIVDSLDMAALLTALILGGGGPGDNYTIVAPSQDLLDCMDLADTTSIGPPDGLINIGDMASLLTHLILYGDSQNNYEAPCIEIP